MKKKNSSFYIGSVLFGICVLFLLSGIFLPLDPEYTEIASKYASPSFSHIFGCDHFGRDLFARVASGTSITILVSFSVNIAALFLGGIIGSVSGYFGKIVDSLFMQLSDAFMAIPGLLLALMLIAVGGSGMPILILALSVVFFPSYTRVIRNGIRQLKDRDYVQNARLLKIPHHRILFSYIFPGILPQLLPAFVLGLGNAALAEASMSYLGLGVQPPAASWGKLLSEGQAHLFSAPWMIIFPAILLAIYVLSLYFLSEGLRVFLKKEGTV